MRTPRLPSGLRAAGIACGLRGEEQPERLDLGLLVADQARPAAAVFTRSKLLGAHIPLCREHLDASGGLGSHEYRSRYQGPNDWFIDVFLENTSSIEDQHAVLGFNNSGCGCAP